MIALRSALSDYLAMRRALGYKLRRTEKLLLQFIEYAEMMTIGEIDQRRSPKLTRAEAR